jgi:hypothetical protein
MFDLFFCEGEKMKGIKAIDAMRNGIDNVVDEYCDSSDCPDKNNCPKNCKIRQFSRWIWGMKEVEKKGERKQSSTK